jgi:thiosulfate/3-mercaptopyruvate sulfurtransferase
MELLANAAWVAERLHDPNLVIVDATLPPVGVKPAPDMHAHYLQEHVPGAVFFDIDALSDASSGLPHTLPSPKAFGESMEQLGVGRAMTIVVYEQDGVFSAPRGLWMLRVMGAQDVRLLNGGLKAWKDAGLPVEAGEVRRKPASFAAALAPGAVTSFDQLQQVIASSGQILDARSAGRFSGAAPEPRPGIASGHMPGATSMPFTDLVENGRVKQPEALKAMFAEKHVDLKKPLTTTCGSGVTAAVVSLALELAGADTISLYDGSWAEYAQRPEAKIMKDA